MKQRLIQMLCDMPGLDTDIVVHHLPTKEDCPPIKQKVRRMRPEMSEKIKAEVMKQFDAGFLAVTMWKYLPGLTKICLVWIPTLWFITCLLLYPKICPPISSTFSHHKTLGTQDPVRVSSAQDFSLHC